MSIVQQKQMVEKYVNVIRCDGPDCNVERVVESVREDHIPDGWWYNRQSISYHESQERSDVTAGGPWHFHNIRCQLAWSKDRIEHEPTDDKRH